MFVFRQIVCDVSFIAIAGSWIMLLVLDSYSVDAILRIGGEHYGASSFDPMHHSTIVSGYGSHRYPLTCRAPKKLPLGNNVHGDVVTPLYLKAQNGFTSSSQSPSNDVHLFLVTTNVTASISASMNKHSMPLLHRLNVSRIDHADAIWAKCTETSDVWIPIEGIFGVYILPSGFLIVWIVRSQPIYKAPAIDLELHNRSTATSWFEVNRISELHLTHIAFSPINAINKRSKLSRGELLEEKRQLQLLRKSLKDHHWYFAKSDRMIIPDLTRNLQSCFLLGPPSQLNSSQTEGSLFNETTLKGYKPESHFFWNEALVQPFRDAEAAASNETAGLCRTLLEHIVPVTSAFCGVQTNISLLDESDANLSKSLRYDQILISRRSRHRAGTRFTRRGSDDTGAVANFAETEQILILWKPQNNMSCFSNKILIGVMSYVQTRGSIPLLWSSPTDVKTYRPRVRIGTDPMAQARAFRNHLIDYASRYTVVSKNGMSLNGTAQILMVNLIDMKSDQGRLGKAMDSVLKALLDVHESGADSSLPWLTKSFVEHLWFDFHAEVKSGRWHKLIGLLEQVQPYLTHQSYFFAEPRHMQNSATTRESTLEVKKLQIGSIRTNCMDCLDRTNVVQSIFGRFMLFQLLAEFKPFALPFPFKLAFRREPTSLPWRNGEVAHRLLWADNADEISRLYAGTVALKGDFTRTGKRTRKGAINDGLNSVQRYYLNNFLDAARQEGIDLMVGNELFCNVEGLHGDGSNGISERKNKLQRMNNHDSAQQGMVHEFRKAGKSNDRDHVRIKVKHPDKVGLFPRRLDLRWLPGDLQMQVRNLIKFSDHLSDNHKEALQDIDCRATSDMPWWVLPDSSASE